jgi:hypothetical protein
MSLFTTSDTLNFQFQLVLGEEVNTELSINFYFNRLTGGDGVAAASAAAATLSASLKGHLHWQKVVAKLNVMVTATVIE